MRVSVFSRVVPQSRAARRWVLYRGQYGGGSFGFRLEVTPIVLRLLIANGAVWFLQWVFHTGGSSFVENAFALDPDTVLPWRPWQLVTYMFLHGPGFWHIGFNMLILWMFGGPVERQLGAKRFLRYYLICGIAGGVLQLLPPFRATTVGASGAVLGVLTAFGVLFPNAPIHVLFLFPVPAKVVVIFLALMNLMSAAGSSRDGIAYMAHVGGMAAGYIMLRGMPFTERLRRRWDERQHDLRSQRREDVRRKLDDILEKMHREGKESLSQDDWNTLLDESRRRRND